MASKADPGEVGSVQLCTGTDDETGTACNNTLKPSDKFCSKCGTKRTPVKPKPKPRPRQSFKAKVSDPNFQATNAKHEGTPTQNEPESDTQILSRHKTCELQENIDTTSIGNEPQKLENQAPVVPPRQGASVECVYVEDEQVQASPSDERVQANKNIQDSVSDDRAKTPTELRDKPPLLHPRAKKDTARNLPARVKSIGVVQRRRLPSPDSPRHASWGGGSNPNAADEGKPKSDDDETQEPYAVIRPPTMGGEEGNTADESYIKIYDDVAQPVLVIFIVWLSNAFTFNTDNDKVVLCIADARPKMKFVGLDPKSGLKTFTLRTPVPPTYLAKGICYGYEIHCAISASREALPEKKDHSISHRKLIVGNDFLGKDECWYQVDGIIYQSLPKIKPTSTREIISEEEMLSILGQLPQFKDFFGQDSNNRTSICKNTGPIYFIEKVTNICECVVKCFVTATGFGHSMKEMQKVLSEYLRIQTSRLEDLLRSVKSSDGDNFFLTRAADASFVPFSVPSQADLVQLVQRKTERSDESKTRICYALALVYIIVKFKTRITEADAHILCCALLVRPKQNHQVPDEVAAVEEQYKKFGAERLREYLLSFLSMICGKKMVEPSWVLVVPFCHLLDEQKKNENVKSDEWWGVNGLEGVIKEYHKKFPKAEHFRQFATCLDSLITHDPLLVRTLLSILKLDNLTVENARYFPLDVLLAGLCVNTRCQPQRVKQLFGIMKGILADEHIKLKDNAKDEMLQLHVLRKSVARAVTMKHCVAAPANMKLLLSSYSFALDCMTSVDVTLGNLSSIDVSGKTSTDMDTLRQQYQGVQGDILKQLWEMISKHKDDIRSMLQTSFKRKKTETRLSSLILSTWKHCMHNPKTLTDLNDAYWAIFLIRTVIIDFKTMIEPESLHVTDNAISAVNPLMKFLKSPGQQSKDQLRYILDNREKMCLMLSVVEGRSAESCKDVMQNVRMASEDPVN